jgi:hypothetical protein
MPAQSIATAVPARAKPISTLARMRVEPPGSTRQAQKAATAAQLNRGQCDQTATAAIAAHAAAARSPSLKLAASGAKFTAQVESRVL